MKVHETALPGVLLIEPKRFRDERGYFQELWHDLHGGEAGLSASFVQDNLSASGAGVLRGLHYQHPNGQGKLITCLDGAVYDVAVDIRVGSPNFGRWAGFELDAARGGMLYIPPGFAHGFAVTGERAVILYKCTRFYSPADEGAVLWSDPDLGIAWPVAMPVISPKDGDAPRLRDIPAHRLPRHG